MHHGHKVTSFAVIISFLQDFEITIQSDILQTFGIGFPIFLKIEVSRDETNNVFLDIRGSKPNSVLDGLDRG